MIHHRSTLAALVAGVLAVSASQATAQLVFTTTLASTAKNESVSKSHSRTAGNEYLGLTGYAYGYMKSYVADTRSFVTTGSGAMTLASANARGYLRATANILKSTAELGRFDASGNVYSRTNGVTINGSYKLYLAGQQMVREEFQKTSSFPRFSKYISLLPKDARTDIPVGPLTVTIKGNAGVGIESFGFGMLTTNPAVGLSFTANAWGQGSASVAVGIFGFAIGAEVSARLAEQTVGVNLWANRSGISGRLEYLIQALRLKLKVFAHALWGLASYSKEILDREWGSYSTVLFDL